MKGYCGSGSSNGGQGLLEPEPPTPRRCPDGNFAVTAKSLKPLSIYEPSTAPFYDKSSYKTSFNAKPINKVYPFYPKQAIGKAKGYLDDLSHYKEQFIAHETKPYEKPPWAKAMEFQPSDGIMLDARQTSYNSAYTGSPGGSAKSAKRDGKYRPNQHPFDGTTTHKADYTPFCAADRARSFKPNAHVGAKLCPCGKFNGATTYKIDFTPKSGVRRQKIMPRGLNHFLPGTFAGETTYSVSYEPFYYEKCEPCIPAALYDRLYPKSPCSDVSCFPPVKRDDF